MPETRPDITTTLFALPPDAKFLAVSELAPRVRARIGPVDEGYAVIEGGAQFVGDLALLLGLKGEQTDTTQADAEEREEDEDVDGEDDLQE